MLKLIHYLDTKEDIIMNIQVQCCGLVMMGLLLYFYLRQKTVGLYTEKIFLRTLVVMITCVVLDVLSIVAITYRSFIPEFLLYGICKTYIVSIIWVCFCTVAYVVTDLYNEKEYYKAVKKYFFAVCFASLVVYILPIYYYHENDVIFTYGSSVLMTYVFSVLFIICILYHIIRYSKQLNAKRRDAVLMWMIAWLVAAGIQFMDNERLLVGFACALGMMILFFALENPESNMDRQVGCFNSHALLEFVKQEFGREHDFSIMLISMDHYQKQNEQDRINTFIRELVQYLETISDIKIFKNVAPELVIVVKDEEAVQRVLGKIQESFLPKKNAIAKKKDDMQYIPLFVLVENGRIAKSAEELLRLIDDFKKKAVLTEGVVVVSIDEEAVKESHEKKEMEEIIIKALEEDRVEVFYQPIYSTKSNRFVSAEALVRIRNKDGSIIPPGKFISVAEETGLIAKLGERVFEKTCQLLQDYQPQQYGIEYIEVNLSVIQCNQKNLASTYMKIMDKYQINPAMINLEITETASVQTKKVLLENMATLMDYGVTFSLDDFGNGQSNLDYLIDMPISIMKLDMNMTRAYFDKKKAKYAVKATVNMVHDMQLKVVAEGIETKEQLVAMNKIGIDYIQGYYFSKPLPTDEFLEFIKIKRNEEE